MLLAFAFAAALDAAPATQPTTAAPPAKAEEKAKPDVICRYEDVLGTRFKKKVCVTREQEEAARADNRRALDRIQSQTGIAPGY